MKTLAQPDRLTWPELQVECIYRYTEHLGMLCGDQQPTPAQIAIAEGEVDRFRKEINA